MWLWPIKMLCWIQITTRGIDVRIQGKYKKKMMLTGKGFMVLDKEEDLTR